MRTLTIIAALAALPGMAVAQGTGEAPDETPGGGMEEAAALYFAPPPTEEAKPAIDQARLVDAGTVRLAIMLGQVEDALGACQALRRDMQDLIGDTYGSYSVNPGWLRRYQACVLARSDEVRAIGRAVNARRTELISRVGSGEDEAGDAMRAADLMARLAARQSDVKIAVAREGRRQRAFVGYYNTGEFPDALRETPADERGSPQRERLQRSPGVVDEPLPTDLPTDPPMGGAILREGEAIEGAVPMPAPPPAGASGAPTPLRGPAAEPMDSEL